MPTPDAAAAAEPQHVPLHELTHEHVGAVLTYRGVTGTLTDLPARADVGDDLAFPLQESGKSFLTVASGPADSTAEIVYAAPPSPYDDVANAEVSIPEHIRAGRELAAISDSIKAHKGEIEGLEARAAELDKVLKKYFELAGDTKFYVDGRAIYQKPRSFAAYCDRPAEEGGGKYGSADVVAAFREVGRTGDIKPPSVNPQTLGAILREYRDAEKPVPEALAKVVRLDEEIKIAVGAPRRARR